MITIIASAVMAAAPTCPTGTWMAKKRLKDEVRYLCRRWISRSRWVLHGPWWIYNKRGKLSSRGAYRNGKRHGRWLVWRNWGTIKAGEANYRNGKLHGRWWWQSGCGIERKHYRNGKLHGYYSDTCDTTYTTGAYRHGRKHGRWITHSLNSLNKIALASDCRWRNGKEIRCR